LKSFLIVPFFLNGFLVKKIIWLLFGLLIFANSYSQKKKPSTAAQQSNNEFVRCATMERVEMLFRKFPERKLRAERLSRETTPANGLRFSKRLTSITTIPVVFHIVLPNPYVVTDQVIQSQIDQMNIDFGGLNPDSTNIPAAFQTVRGHSLIRFVLAKRTPSGGLTNGIERKSGFATGNPNNDIDSIKRSSLGGADSWNPDAYVNIWVGNIANNSQVLGYTQIAGSGNPLDDGVFCNWLALGISACNIKSFNKGRTIVHELGHYFGLNHIWGDDESNDNKCSGDDFRALTDDGSSYILPASLYNPHGKGNTSEDIGDTPNQEIASSNCGSGVVTDNCTTTAPGIMYQNFMDYTLDDCYSLFTKKQVARMEYVLQNFRAGLLNSSGATAPANAVARDASAIFSVNPGGMEASNCSSVSYPSLLTCGGNFVPKVMIRNNGLNTITSIKVGYTLNNGSPVIVSLSTNISSGGTQVVTFPGITVSTGVYNFNFFTSDVNNSGNDAVPSNDAVSATLAVPTPVTLPVNEGFENAFPPTGWSLSNADDGVTWQVTTPGNNSTHSMFINNFENNSVGQVDEIRTPKINLNNSNPIQITFDLAHKNYPDTDYNDRLEVLVSNDCGATFTSYFNKAGANLSTAGSSSSSYLNPEPGDWKTQKIILDGAILGKGNIIVAFRNTSDWGNNTFIDNINIRQVVSRDLTVTAVNPPTPTECAQPTIPIAVVKNLGNSTITGFKVSYTIDNGSPSQTVLNGITLAAGAEMNVPLNVFTPPVDQHTITVFTSDPVSFSGTGDESKTNDTLKKTFFVIGNVELPINEGFENATFPPATWSVENPDDGITWQRTTDAAKTGVASMVIKNFDYATSGATDKLVSSVISGTANFDSIFVAFDYAYATGSSTSIGDTLELQLSTDCGKSFITVWKNGGKNLQTTSANFAGKRFVPGATEWAHLNLNVFNSVGTDNFQLYLVAKNNHQNNLYVDNLSVYGITLPARLKKQGYLIYPSPFRQQFIIRNYEVPVSLQSAHIYNSVGQLVWSKDFNGNAYTEMPVDMGSAPAGIYILKLQYTNKTVVEKIVKQ
jgi:hypothetical protein